MSGSARATAGRGLLAQIDAPRWQAVCLVLALLSGAPFAGLLFTVVQPILPSIASSFGGGHDAELRAQMFTTMADIGLIVGGFAGGWLVDRIGPKPIFYFGLFAYGLAGSAGLWTENAWVLLGSRLLLGFACVSFTVAGYWFIAACFDGPGRTKVLGYRQAAGGIGGFVGVLLAGYMADRFGWHASFSIYVAAFAIVLVLVMVARPLLPDRATGTAETAPWSGLVPLVPIYLLIFALAILMMMPVVQLPFLLSQRGVTQASTIALVAGISSLGSLTTAFLYGTLRQRLGQQRTLALITLLLGGGMLTIGLSANLVATAAGAVVMGCGAGLFSPFFGNLLMDRAPLELRGRALAMVVTMTYAGNFANPAVFYPIRQVIGIGGGFIAGGALLLTVLAGTLLYRRLRPAAVVQGAD